MNWSQALFSALKSELLKFYLLKMHIRILFLNTVTLVLLIGMNLKFSGSNPEFPYSMESHKTILNIHIAFSKYIYLFILSTMICSNFGKEYEWKTIHQFLIKGLNSTNMILSKTIAYWLLFTAEYIVYTFLVFLGFFLFSPESMSVSFQVISWSEVLTIPLGILLGIVISVLSVSISFASTQGLVLNFLYYIVVEIVIRGIISLINAFSPKDYLETIVEFFPYSGYVSINPENPDVGLYILSTVVYIGIFLGASLILLRKKEFALVNT